MRAGGYQGTTWAVETFWSLISCVYCDTEHQGEIYSVIARAERDR